MINSHRYSAVTDWAADMAQVADELDAERLGIVGLSGGGPYALACGALAPLVARVAALAILDGTAPSVGPEAAEGAASPTLPAGSTACSRSCAGSSRC